MLIGAPFDDNGGTDRGQAFVVYGGPSGAFIDPTISADGKTATFADHDGDLVTIKVRKATCTTPTSTCSARMA